MNGCPFNLLLVVCKLAPYDHFEFFEILLRQGGQTERMVQNTDDELTERRLSQQRWLMGELGDLPKDPFHSWPLVDTCRNIAEL